jgi:general stress protein CsbA
MPNQDVPNTPIQAKQQNLNGLFSLESLLSLQGATAATLMVTNILVYLFGRSVVPYQKWVALVMSLAVSFWAASLASKKGSGKWLLALLNGLLVFASTAGLNQIGAAVSGSAALSAEHISFFHSWF